MAPMLIRPYAYPCLKLLLRVASTYTLPSSTLGILEYLHLDNSAETLARYR
jgi:hypothetical protein